MTIILTLLHFQIHKGGHTACIEERNGKGMQTVLIVPAFNPHFRLAQHFHFATFLSFMAKLNQTVSIEFRFVQK